MLFLSQILFLKHLSVRSNYGSCFSMLSDNILKKASSEIGFGVSLNSSLVRLLPFDDLLYRGIIRLSFGAEAY